MIIKSKSNYTMIRKIYAALKTAQVRYAGTKSDVLLVLSQEHEDLLYQTIETPNGLEPGKAAFFQFDIAEQNIPFGFSYVRMGIRGADAWNPEYVFVWAEKDPEYENDYVVQPIAFDASFKRLSTDKREGRTSVPVSRAYYGGFYNMIQQVLVVITTSDKRNSATKSPIRLQIDTVKGNVINIPLSDDALMQGGVFMDTPQPSEPFNFHDLRKIELITEGNDLWMPHQVFVFGYQETEYAEQKIMTPLVYIPDWSATGLPRLSTDPKEGAASIMLYQAFL